MSEEFDYIPPMWSNDAPIEERVLYVTSDPVSARWGFFTTPATANPFPAIYKRCPSLCIWRSWKTKWPTGAAAALETSIESALLTLGNSTKTSAGIKWFEEDTDVFCKVVMDLLQHFGTALPPAEETTFDF
jgi:hypothetical protein